MVKKIPDQIHREEKIAKLKKKILNEIDSLLERFKVEAAQAECSMGNFEFAAKNSFALFKLREYINNPASFNQIWGKGYIIIKDLHINMWLQEDYTFAFDFLVKAEENDYNVFPLLNDEFFELHFTNIVDEILYEQKLQEKQNEKGESGHEN